MQIDGQNNHRGCTRWQGIFCVANRLCTNGVRFTFPLPLPRYNTTLHCAITVSYDYRRIQVIRFFSFEIYVENCAGLEYLEYLEYL